MNYPRKEPYRKEDSVPDEPVRCGGCGKFINDLSDLGERCAPERSGDIVRFHWIETWQADDLCRSAGG